MSNSNDTIRRVRVTYVASMIGCSKSQKQTIRSLGLRRLGDVVEHDDIPAIRGMINAVRHLVRVEDIQP